MPRGDGYFRKRGNTLYWEFMYRRKRYTIRLGSITKSEARHIVAGIKAKIISGEWDEEREPVPLVRDILSAYEKHYLKNTNARKRSVECHIQRIERFRKYIGSVRASEVSWFTIENYKSRRLKEGASKSTVNRELRILKSAFNKAKALGIYKGEVPPIEFFKESKNERLRFLTPEEAEKLISACPEWFRPVVVFALNTGLRAGEIFSMKWENVDFKNRVLRIEPGYTKTKDTYTLPMNDAVYSLLKEIRKKQADCGIKHGYVFTNSRGLPYKYEDRTYRKVFVTACRKAGIKDFRFHDLRHTFASWVAINSKDIYAVQKLLNHKKIETTKRYAHLTERYLRDVVNSLSDFGSFSSTSGFEEASGA